MIGNQFLIINYKIKKCIYKKKMKIEVYNINAFFKSIYICTQILFLY